MAQKVVKTRLCKLRLPHPANRLSQDKLRRSLRLRLNLRLRLRLKLRTNLWLKQRSKPRSSLLPITHSPRITTALATIATTMVLETAMVAMATLVQALAQVPVAKSLLSSEWSPP